MSSRRTVRTAIHSRYQVKRGTLSGFETWVIRMSVKSMDREEILGCMHERFFELSATEGQAAARRWLRIEVLFFLFELLRSRLPALIGQYLVPLGRHLR